MSFLNMVQRGNIKRIKELDVLGLRPDAIIQLFARHGITISARLVDVVLSGELDDLDKVALPKSAVNEVSAELNNISQGLLPA